MATRGSWFCARRSWKSKVQNPLSDGRIPKPDSLKLEYRTLQSSKRLLTMALCSDIFARLNNNTKQPLNPLCLDKSQNLYANWYRDGTRWNPFLGKVESFGPSKAWPTFVLQVNVVAKPIVVSQMRAMCSTGSISSGQLDWKLPKKENKRN